MTTDHPSDTTAICFVCLGNICRSPTAEGVFLDLLRKRGCEHRYVVDSAGTGNWHVGSLPDVRSQIEAKRRGLELESRARQFKSADFDRFDYVIAMDRSNLSDLKNLAPSPEHEQKLKLLRDFEPENTQNEARDVPDPYYGGDQGFAEVFDLCTRSCEALLNELEQQPSAG